MDRCNKYKIGYTVLIEDRSNKISIQLEKGFYESLLKQRKTINI